jgi:hypothetical protein
VSEGNVSSPVANSSSTNAEGDSSGEEPLVVAAEGGDGPAASSSIGGERGPEGEEELPPGEAGDEPPLAAEGPAGNAGPAPSSSSFGSEGGAAQQPADVEGGPPPLATAGTAGEQGPQAAAAEAEEGGAEEEGGGARSPLEERSEWHDPMTAILDGPEPDEGNGRLRRMGVNTDSGWSPYSKEQVHTAPLHSWYAARVTEKYSETRGRVEAGSFCFFFFFGGWFVVGGWGCVRV